MNNEVDYHKVLFEINYGVVKFLFRYNVAVESYQLILSQTNTGTKTGRHYSRIWNYHKKFLSRDSWNYKKHFMDCAIIRDELLFFFKIFS